MRIGSLLIVLVLFGGGCPRPTGPDRAVVDWLAAVDRGDGAGGRALLATAARAGNDAASVSSRARTLDDTALRRAQEAAGDAHVAAVEARWAFGDGALVVVHADGRWALRDGVLGLYPCGTPEDALRSFVRAWRRERWDVVHRLAPRAVRERFAPAETAERLRSSALRDLLDARAAALEEALAPDVLPTAPARVAADTLTIPYGPFHAAVVLEDGCWRVADL